jgi:hypothetical protein
MLVEVRAMSYYENREIRIRALTAHPDLTRYDYTAICSMLLGCTSWPSDEAVRVLASRGIRVDELRSGQRYISYVEA